MNDPNDVERAWRFVKGFDVPTLTRELTEDWRLLISALSADQFTIGARKSRARPDNQLHLRPSIEAFKGYAGHGVQEAGPRYDEWQPIPRVDNTRFDPRKHPAIVKAREDLAKAKG